MWITLIIALVLSLGAVQSGLTEILKRENPVASRDSARTVAHFRAFSFAASRYMDKTTIARPASGSVKKITWDGEIRHSAWTPPGARNISMPPSWYVELDSAGKYVICATLDESAVAALGQLMPDEIALHGVAEGAGVNPNNKLVFAADQASATTLGVNACRG